MSAFRKFGVMILAVVGAVVAALVPALGDNVVSANEWLNVTVIGAGAASIFAASNVPGARYTKTLLAVITACATLAASLITDGLTQAEVAQLVVAALAAAGVYRVPNVGDMLDRAQEFPVGLRR